MNTLRANFITPDELEFQVVELNFAIAWVGAEPEPRDSGQEIEDFAKEQKTVNNGHDFCLDSWTCR